MSNVACPLAFDHALRPNGGRPNVSLKLQIQQAAPGLTPRSALKKMASIQMLDVHMPTTDGRELRMSRFTQALPEHRMILEKLNLKLPKQPKPRIYAKT